MLEAPAMLVFEPVQAAIWHCINHYAYNNAIFLAERLYAEMASEEALYLLATCYYRAGRTSMAYSILTRRGVHSPKGRFLLAKCCVDLLKIAEAEQTLKSNILSERGGPLSGPLLAGADEPFVAEFGEEACFVLHLLGVCAAKTRRLEIAIRYFERSLKLNPFLWDSYEQICNLGGNIAPEEVFSVARLDDFSNCHGVNPVVSLVNQELGQQHDGGGSLQPPPVPKKEAKYNKSTPVTQNCGNTCAVRLFVTPEESVPMTPSSLGLATLSSLSTLKSKKNRLRGLLSPLQLPSFGILPFSAAFDCPTLLSPEILQKPSKRALIKETPLQHGKVFTQSGNTERGSTNSPPLPSIPIVRRSTRLFSNNASVKENNKSPKHGKYASSKSPSRKSKRQAPNAKNSLGSYAELTNNEKNLTNSDLDKKEDKQVSVTMQALEIQKKSAEGLMSLLRDIGTAVQLLSRYECANAISAFNRLPLAQLNTGWVQGMIGKAYLELPDYYNSALHFRKMRELDPERVEMCELYSTALWFLQKEVELSALSQQLLQQARTAPQTWCAAANCFSLHKEHDTAIKFLHRAIQVDSWFGYAYTLLGHEYLAAEELDKALACFRNSIRISSRDYSAYFGLGSVYSKQEKFELAQAHYNMAEAINPRNVTILCHLGVVQNAQQKPEAALNWFNKALSIDPRNPLSKFQRANVYFNIGRDIEALCELEELKLIVPKESMVYYLMGKIHKRLGDTDRALMHFSWAMDLDPKGAHTQIKETIDPTLQRSGTPSATASTSTNGGDEGDTSGVGNNSAEGDAAENGAGEEAEDGEEEGEVNDVGVDAVDEDEEEEEGVVDMEQDAGDISDESF